MKILLSATLFCFTLQINAQVPSQVVPVDLGLPSGTLWANMNLGAIEISDYGDYFAWGETTPKSNYSSNTYKYYDTWIVNDSTYIDENGFTVEIKGGTFGGYTKYVPQSESEKYGYKGYYDNLSVLDIDDDAAYKNWGGNWQMPTQYQLEELVRNCTWTWASINGIKGYKVTGSNGNYIFLPAAGYRENDNPYNPGELFFQGEIGDYLSKNKGDWVQYARSLYIDKNKHTTWNTLINGKYNGYRFRGCSIRPVYTGEFVGKCAKPSIAYENGKLIFKSTTDNAKFVYTISDNDIVTGTTNGEVSLLVTYSISVHAIADGYFKSDAATATLCWIDKEPQTEGITNSVAQLSATPILIQSNGGTLSVQGANDGTQVSIYNAAGQMAGSSVSSNGHATIFTNLEPGTIAIVKIGAKSVKVVIK